MKTLLAAISIFALVASTTVWAAETGESWEQFRKMREQSEQINLIPKGQKSAPKLIPKDIIIEQLRKPAQDAPPQPPQPGRTDPGPPPQGTAVFSSDAILFDYGSARLRETSFPQLMEIARAFTDPQLAHIPFFFVDGHTCDIGSDENNCRLSWDRANSVIEFLVTAGRLDPQKLRPRGFGERTPMMPNASDYMRTLNRRVVLKSGGAPMPMEEAVMCRMGGDWRSDYGSPYQYDSQYRQYMDRYRSGEPAATTAEEEDPSGGVLRYEQETAGDGREWVYKGRKPFKKTIVPSPTGQTQVQPARPPAGKRTDSPTGTGGSTDAPRGFHREVR